MRIAVLADVHGNLPALRAVRRGNAERETVAVFDGEPAADDPPLSRGPAAPRDSPAGGDAGSPSR